VGKKYELGAPADLVILPDQKDVVLPTENIHQVVITSTEASTVVCVL